MPFLYGFVQMSVTNYMIFYALSEERRKEGIKQFGDDFPIKLRQLIYTLRDNFT